MSGWMKIFLIFLGCSLSWVLLTLIYQFIYGIVLIFRIRTQREKGEAPENIHALMYAWGLIFRGNFHILFLLPLMIMSFVILPLFNDSFIHNFSLDLNITLDSVMIYPLVILAISSWIGFNLVKIYTPSNFNLDFFNLQTEQKTFFPVLPLFPDKDTVLTRKKHLSIHILQFPAILVGLVLMVNLIDFFETLPIPETGKFLIAVLVFVIVGISYSKISGIIRKKYPLE